MNRGRGPVLVTAAAAVALVLAATVALARSGPSLLGTNGVGPAAFVVVLPTGGRACDVSSVPAGARSVRMTLGTFGRPGVATVTGTASGRTLLVGRARFREGVVDLPIGETRRVARGVRLCITNRGRGVLAVAGRRISDTPPSATLSPGSRLSLEFPAGGNRATWLDRASRILGNAGRARLLPGGEPLLWLALALALAAGVGAAAVVLRAGRR